MLSRSVKLYNIGIYIIGILAVIGSYSSLMEKEQFGTILFYIGIAFVTESLTVDIGSNAAISLGFAIGIACAVLFTPTVTALILFLGTLLHIEYSEKHLSHLFNTDFSKRLFNACAYAIIGYVSAWVYNVDFGFRNLLGSFFDFSIFHVLLSMISYIFICIFIYAILFSLLQKQPLWKSILDFAWLISKFIAVAPIGMIIASAQAHYGWFSTLLFMGPLLLARYSFVQYLQMKEHYLKTINSFTRALDAKDQYTNGHSERVAFYSVELAKKMMLPNKQIEELKTAALLHDIGKIGITDTILNKPGKLSLQEFYEIKRHPEIGARIIEEIPFLKHTAALIRHHHERIDGTGYPDSLKDHEIPLESKIISIADTYDAMTSDRPYRLAMTKEKAIQIIMSESGRQFNIEIVDSFVAMLKESDIHVD